MSQVQSQALLSVPFRYFLKRHRIERGSAVAVVDGLTGESITYAELHDRVSRIAGWLVRNGIGHGDRVACLSLNSKGYTELFLALAWMGRRRPPQHAPQPEGVEVHHRGLGGEGHLHGRAAGGTRRRPRAPGYRPWA